MASWNQKMWVMFGNLEFSHKWRMILISTKNVEARYGGGLVETDGINAFGQAIMIESIRDGGEE